MVGSEIKVPKLVTVEWISESSILKIAPNWFVNVLPAANVVAVSVAEPLLSTSTAICAFSAVNVAPSAVSIFSVPASCFITTSVKVNEESSSTTKLEAKTKL